MTTAIVGATPSGREGAWPLAAMLAAFVVVLLGVVVVDLVRATRPAATTPPAHRRRPALLGTACAVLLGALALALWCTLVDADVLDTRQELPIASLVFGSAIAGLAALAWALRILALPPAARSSGDGVMLAVAATFALGVGSCYGVLIVPSLLDQWLR